MLDVDAIDQLSQSDSAMKELLCAVPSPISLIAGPDGGLLGDPVEQGEGMVAADIDISRSIEQKMIHDIVGHYNRFDIFHLGVDPTPNRSVWIKRPVRREQHLSDDSPQVLEEETTQPPDERQAPTSVRRAQA